MESPLIYSAIIDAMGQVSAVSKGRHNSTQGFSYRGIDDVMNELHGILAKCGIFIVPTVLEEQRTQGTTSKGGNMFYTRQKIKFTFFAKDGSNIEAIVIGEAMDSGDKASNKALSIGLKYALLQVFCIPTEEDKDPDGVSPDWQEQKTTAPKNTAPANTVQEDPSTAKARKEREELKTLITTFEKPLTSSTQKPNPYDLCCEALAENDPDRIAEMIGRVKKYLETMGIKYESKRN